LLLLGGMLELLVLGRLYALLVWRYCGRVPLLLYW
jgi:hypothetical protein